MTVYQLFVLTVFTCGITGNTGADDLGCYKDVTDKYGDRLMTPTFVRPIHNLTLELCHNNCLLQYQFAYFAVSFSTECYCGDIYWTHGILPRSSCQENCSGNSAQKCGGDQALSVYRVCELGTYGTMCSESCHCRNNANCSRMAGTCDNGCQAGWSGSASRCNIDVNECLQSKAGCQYECFNTPGSYYCTCKEGFILASDQKLCVDIDECTKGTHDCDNINGTCENTQGSYKCGCKTGFELNLPRIKNQCIDIDECKRNISDCDVMNGSCHNTPGSYDCLCKEGYGIKTTLGKKICTEMPQGKGNAHDDGVTVGLIVAMIAALIIGFVIIIFLYIRWRRSKLSSLSNGHAAAVRMTEVKKRPTIVVQVFQDDDNASNTQLLDAEEEVNEENNQLLNPIYANFVRTSIASTTRIKITDLPTFVERVNNSPDLLHDEFKTITETSDDKYDFAQKAVLKPKNRFKNILPYNYNRVTLSMIDGDELSTYINASFVKGYKESDKFIASHGPTVSTIDDFWRMIWEYDVCFIVMVTNCKEEAKTKCEQYWPELDAMTHAGIIVTPSFTQILCDHVLRRFDLFKEGVSRMVTQIQFTDWPDHGVPDHATSLLSVRNKVRRLADPNKYVVVHCSAGVGRTGTYLAIDYLLCEAAETQEIDIYERVKSLRKQRMNCVQTLEQYTFISKALLEGLELGDTTIPCNVLSQRVADLTKRNPVTKKSLVQTEFDMLCKMQPPFNTEMCNDALTPENINKNRNPECVPGNAQRVFLNTALPGRTDYINAVFVSGYKNKAAYIATQLPLDDTVCDFWQMCMDYNCKVILFLSKINNNNITEISGILPKSGKSLTFGKICLTYLCHEPANGKNPCDVYTVALNRGAEVQDDENAKIYENTQVLRNDEITILDAKLPTGRADLDETILRINGAVTSLLDKHKEDGPLVVMCRDGIKWSGLYIAAANCTAMIQAQDEVDVVQTVLSIKLSQPHFISAFYNYDELYRIAELYVTKAATYANVL